MLGAPGGLGIVPEPQNWEGNEGGTRKRRQEKSWWRSAGSGEGRGAVFGVTTGLGTHQSPSLARVSGVMRMRDSGRRPKCAPWGCAGR